MSGKKKSIGEIRKQEICQAAIECFIEKGFHNTTMEDVIAKTDLSKGGVYYHYKSTREMIFDIFIEGNNHRINLIKKYIKDNNLSIKDLADEDIMAELMVEKILTDSPLMQIYAQFLVETNYDRELFQTYQKIQESSKEELLNFFDYENENKTSNEEFMFITYILNTFILGVNILNARENFELNRKIIKEMVKSAIIHFKAEK
ncbi:TetR/AcrR family transcriptional regulator [Peptostreptococcus canis]|uniref:TetR/AcrR family transcriptional regulator n=1 Tax=Peptostreptococcus canis TaxID=1159213 RepID=A0ABR6TKD5_9FIRM|nr:TetR/AcrR family transcriptional regulator [Peptostreptococcus canis]MBC2575862.1 TetR/AcrR family transcriptional regulator [Peptostreptococcus canis]MBP1998018.1 AcrR family transcriptional regulator [Peptostreptococcus canis]